MMSKLLLESKLINENFDCIVIPMHFSSALADLGKVSITKIWKMVIYVVRLVYNLTSNRPSIVYFTLCPTGNIFYRDLVFALIVKCFNIKIIYHLHVRGIAQEARRSRIKNMLYGVIFRNEITVCLSESLALELHGFCSEIRIINNGIPVMRTQARGDLSESKPPCILYLSNLIKSKGVFDFLEALKILSERGMNFIAFIAGNAADVSYKDVNNFISKNNLGDKVFLSGPKYGPEKNAILQEADIFVFPTFYEKEAFPLVLLEAMQYSLPIISTSIGAIPEIIDDEITGFLIGPNDVAGLVDKITTLLMDAELRKKMGREGGKKFFQYYTFEKFELQMRKTFDNVGVSL